MSPTRTAQDLTSVMNQFHAGLVQNLKIREKRNAVNLRLKFKMAIFHHIS